MLYIHIMFNSKKKKLKKQENLKCLITSLFKNDEDIRKYIIQLCEYSQTKNFGVLFDKYVQEYSNNEPIISNQTEDISYKEILKKIKSSDSLEKKEKINQNSIQMSTKKINLDEKIDKNKTFSDIEDLSSGILDIDFKTGIKIKGLSSIFSKKKSNINMGNKITIEKTGKNVKISNSDLSFFVNQNKRILKFEEIGG